MSSFDLFEDGFPHSTVAELTEPHPACTEHLRGRACVLLADHKPTTHEDADGHLWTSGASDEHSESDIFDAIADAAEVLAEAVADEPIPFEVVPDPSVEYAVAFFGGRPPVIVGTREEADALVGAIALISKHGLASWVAQVFVREVSEWRAAS